MTWTVCVRCRGREDEPVDAPFRECCGGVPGCGVWGWSRACPPPGDDTDVDAGLVQRQAAAGGVHYATSSGAVPAADALFRAYLDLHGNAYLVAGPSSGPGADTKRSCTFADSATDDSSC